jgi:hypothetical protein
MDVPFLVAWEWFQWITIRLALFLALLTLGPSIGLLLLDLLLYVFRTTFDGVPYIGTSNVQVPLDTKGETEVKVEVEKENID